MKKHLFPVLVISLLFFFFLQVHAEQFEVVSGDLQLTLFPETGGFALRSISDRGKNRYEPLFEDRNYGSTSWFSVMCSGRVFKLARRSGNVPRVEEVPGGAKFVFSLNDDFLVEQEFTFMASDSVSTKTSLRIETRIENISGKTLPFAAKALIDTMLGETEGIHFSTDLRPRISTELKLMQGVDQDRYIQSAGKSQTLFIALSNEAVTVPEEVYLANWDRLNTLTWKPSFIEGRSYNTLYSVQDSAVLLVWPEKTIPAKGIYSVHMVLSTVPWTGTSNPIKIAEDTPFSMDAVTSAPTLTAYARYERIQYLLGRIAEIEKNSNIASDEEISSLNRELDILLREEGN